MTATNHVLTGAAIGLAVRNPVAAIALALISHPLTDIMPHYAPRDLPESKLRALSFIDSALAVVAVLLVIVASSVSLWLIVLCALAAVSPDLIWAWRYFRIKSIEKLFDEPMSALSRWHLKIQNELAEGAFVEIIWFALMVTLIIRWR